MALETDDPAAQGASGAGNQFDCLAALNGHRLAQTQHTVQGYFEPQTETGRRILGNPEAPTYLEIRALAFHLASLWEGLAGSAERYDALMLRYHVEMVREATREVFGLIKSVKRGARDAA